MHADHARPRIPLWAVIPGLALLYVAGGRLGLLIDAVSGFATPVWPCSGLALAALLLCGQRAWPGVFLGAACVNLLAGAPLPLAAAIACGNTLEAVLGAAALRMLGFREPLDRLRDVIALVLAALATTTVSATIGVSSVAIAHGSSYVGFGATWRAWWLGDAIGELVVAPVLLSVACAAPLTRARWLEATALAATVVGATWFVFGVPPDQLMPLRQPFILVPVLLWAALRFSQPGAAVSILLVSILAVWGTVIGTGPLSRASVHERLMLLQSFIGSVAVAFLALGAAVAEARASRGEAERERERLYELFERAPVAIAIQTGPNLVYELANPSYRRFLGDRALEGRRLREILPDYATMTKVVERVYATGEAHEGKETVLKVIRPGSDQLSEAICNFVCLPVREPDGTTNGVMTFAFEVSDLVRARQIVEDYARKASHEERWLQAVLDLMPSPLLLIEPQQGTVSFANRRAHELSGGRLSPGTPVGDVPAELPAGRAARGEPLRDLEMDWRTPAGPVSVLVQADTVPAMHGHPATVVMPFQDVTRLKQVEAELQEAVRARDAFLSIASHELKTPCTTLQLQIDGLLRAVERGRSDKLTPERLGERAELLSRHLARLTKLVDDLLDVSRISAGRITLTLEEMDLTALLREVAQRFEPDLVGAACPLSLAVDGPILGRWDRMRVDQVVSNLLSNAIKYGAGAPIELSAQASLERAEITVHDHGIGIAPADQQRIFERFERAGSERQFGGFGLGLWIVRQLLDAMGGSIRVESALGQGARFLVELPRGQ
jgi:signal transduction histidine kinase/integral membrane sensor domain MASE1